MTFGRRPVTKAPQGRAGSVWRLFRGCVSLGTRLMLSLVTLLVLAGVLLWLRLLQGPVELPQVARLAADQINAENPDFQVSIRSMVLTLGSDDEEPGLQAEDLEVRSAEGGLLFDVPRAKVRFALGDLINGRVEPISLTIVEADAHLFRTEAGELRFGIGEGGGMALSTGQAGGRTGSEVGDFERLLDAYAGRDPSVPLFSKLDRIRIEGANFSYDDRQNGSTWSTRDADIAVWRYGAGARALLTISTIDTGTPGASVRLYADRAAEAGQTMIRASFGKLDMRAVAAQLPELEWLEVIDGEAEGQAEIRLDRDGGLEALDGVVISEGGRLDGYGPETGFDFAQVAFSLDPKARQLKFDRVILNAPALDTSLTGVAALRVGADGGYSGLAGQLDVVSLKVDQPEMFPDPLLFDRGQVNFRWDIGAESIELRGTRLSKGDLTFAVDGQARATEAGWITDIRAEASNMTVQDLIGHWPVAAAVNARSWIAENIPEATLPVVLAQMRFGAGEPYLSLDFEYEGLTSTYIAGMTPITRARGRGHMSYHDLHLAMDAGTVNVPGAGAIDLAGSAVTITDFWGEVTPAQVALRASGRTAAILGLIDQAPLRLVRKLGVDLDGIAGTARLRGALAFPLIQDLRVADVAAEVDARLAGVRLPFALGEDRVATVAADRLDLTADTGGMRLRGPIEVDGAQLAMDWRENYGATPGGRTITLDGRATAALRARLGLDTLPVTGSLPFDLRLEQSGEAPMSFRVSADLTPVGVELAAFDWSKAEGTAGRFQASGRLGEGTRLRDVVFEAAGFSVSGDVDLDAAGQIAEARISRLIVPGLADISGTARTGRDGVMEVEVAGGAMDLSGQLDGGEEDAERAPVRVRFALDRLKLSEKVILRGASGVLETGQDGATTGRVAGALAPGAEVTIRFEEPSDGPGTLSLESADAGAVLDATALYRGARGGRLTLDATLGEGSGLTGRVRIEDIVVRSEATFRDVLQDGGLEAAGSDVQSSGIGFRKIWIPFTYADGVITLEDAVATSPALGLKVNGVVNEATDQVDLYGVLSPAYALTGALNEVPLLGNILSGGEGEGILAMTFTLSGPSRDPNLLVNPLSVLAPGFLRKVFSGPASPEGVSDFEDRLRRAE